MKHYTLKDSLLLILSYGLSRIRGDETPHRPRPLHLPLSYGLSRIRGDETVKYPSLVTMTNVLRIEPN